MDSTVSIQHLESRLVRLMEDVQGNRREHNTLRSEVLLAMNQLCSAELLLGIWQTLEDVGARQEMMLVRLLRDLESRRLDLACQQLIGSRDSEVRSIGYAVIALRSRRRGAALIRNAFRKEPAIVLKRGGRRHLAPYSFITCMLAGIREFKVKTLDQLAMGALEDFAGGATDLNLISSLLEDARPEVARLGFVTMASRFMGRIHQHVYDRVIGGNQTPLSTRERKWMRRAVQQAPEVVEAIAEPTPAGLGDAEFIRMRVELLRQLGDGLIGDLIVGLLRETIDLPSVVIESRLANNADLQVLHNERRRTIATIFSLLLGHRVGLAEFVEGLKKDSDLEATIMDQLLELSGPTGALNVTASIVAHWHELKANDPDEGPFWRWLDGLWRDDRHVRVEDAVDSALSRPDETAIYAARILSSLGDPLGQVLRAVRQGHLVDVSDLIPLREQPRLQAALRASFLDGDVEVHPGTIMAIGRSALNHVLPGMRARARHDNEAQTSHALDRAINILQYEERVADHDLFRQLVNCGLVPRDREIETAAEAMERFGRTHPATILLKSRPKAKVLRVYFWMPKAQLPHPVGARPATGFAARAEFVIDDKDVCYAEWSDRSGTQQEVVLLEERPDEYRQGFCGIPWDTPIEALNDAIAHAEGQVMATVPLGGSSPRTRTLIHLNGTQARLDTDSLGRFFRAVLPIDFNILDAAINATEARYGRPTFRTDSSAIWRFEDLEIGIRPDPAFDTLAEFVRVRL